MSLQVLQTLLPKEMNSSSSKMKTISRSMTLQQSLDKKVILYVALRGIKQSDCNECEVCYLSETKAAIARIAFAVFDPL